LLLPLDDMVRARETQRECRRLRIARADGADTASAPEPNACISNFPYCNADPAENAIGTYAQGFVISVLYAALPHAGVEARR